MSETPILDLQRDPPKPRRAWMPLVFGGLIGIALARWISLDPFSWFPVLYLSIAFHEIGHLAAAKLVGMEAGGIVVGGLMIFRSGDRWLWRFDFRRILSGGLAKPLPKKGTFHPAQHAWMIAGGPLATILLAAAAGIARWNSTSPADWLGTLWWVNLFVLVSAFVPAGGLNKSDIPRLWQLLRHPEEARAWAALLQVQSEETAGVLPRDWDPELFALRCSLGATIPTARCWPSTAASTRTRSQRLWGTSNKHFRGREISAGRCANGVSWRRPAPAPYCATAPPRREPGWNAACGCENLPPGTVSTPLSRRVKGATGMPSNCGMLPWRIWSRRGSIRD